MDPRNAMSLCLVALLIAIGGCDSGPVTMQQQPPPPIPQPSGISIRPNTAIARSLDLTLSVVGPAFFNDPHHKSLVAWSAGGTDTFLATTFVDGTHLSAVIPADLLFTPVTAQVVVETGDPVSSLPLTKSNAVTFTVTPIPAGAVVIDSIAPTSATAGSSDITLTVMGANFVNGGHQKSSVVWSESGTDTFLSTTLVSSTQLTAVIPAALLANPGTVQILVETGDPLSSLPGTKSNAVIFTVNSP